MNAPPSPPFVDRYARVRPNGLRPTLRHLAVSALAVLDEARRGLRGGRPPPRVHLLNLHHVFRDEEEGFRALLRWLEESGYAFVDYDEAVRRVRSGEVPEASVTFTFDDGLASGLRAGEILREHGARACYFLVTSMVGETDPGRVQAFCAERIHMPPTAFLGWDEVERLLEMGHAVGSHTHTHPVMGELGFTGALEEVERSAEVLRSRVGEVRHLSWPYGRFRHFSPTARRAVFQVGYESCASAERGAHPPGPALEPEEVCLRREHCVAGWPLAHNRWFLRRGARTADQARRRWPTGWGRRTPQEPDAAATEWGAG